MRTISHAAFVVLVSGLTAGSALAQGTPAPAPAPAPPWPTTPAAPTLPAGTVPTAPAPTMPSMPSMPGAPAGMPGDGSTAWPTYTPPAGGVPQVDQPAPDDKKKDQPKKGGFDAGGQVRFPSGPDEAGAYGTWNWVALDVKGHYNLLDRVSLDAALPLAIIHPDTIGGAGGMAGVEPKTIGGMSVKLEAKLPAVGVSFTGAMMRNGAMLLSEKDFPLFAGDFHPGFATAIPLKIRLGSLLDFKLVPAVVLQKSDTEYLDAIQIPMSLVIKLGSLIKLSTDLGVFTGDDISLRARNGGRIYFGGALDVKIGPILAHGGLGFASLFTDPMGPYPTTKDSFYIDLNVKYAK
jgi:hypothetical protein